VHPAHVILNALRLFVSIFIAFALGLPGILAGLSEADLSAGLVIMLVVGALALLLVSIVLLVVLSYLSYRRFLWEITASDIHIYSGIIFRKQVHIPFARVQSIDFNAGILDRILGLVKLKVETAGGAANKGVVIPALKLNEAEALRAEVFARKRDSEQRQEAAMRQRMEAAGAAVAPPAGDEASKADALVQEVGDEAARLRGIFAEEYREDAPVEYEYGLRAKELFLAALSGDRNLVVFLVLFGALAQLWQFIESIGLGEKTIDAVGTAVTSQTVPTLIVMFIVVFAIIFAASLLLGTLSTALSYGAFKARRRGGRIEVERGLLTRQYKGVSIPRIQAVELRQGLIRRVIGYTEIKLLTIDSVDADSNQQNAQALQGSGLVVHPFIKLSRVADLLTGLLPEFDDRPAPEELRPLPAVSLRRSVIRGGVLPTLIYALVGIVGTVTLLLIPSIPERIKGPILLTLCILLAVLSLLHIVGSVLWYRHAGYAYNSRMLAVRQGSYGMVTTVVPRRKIQWAATRQNPLQRLAGVATITAVTAAGSGGTILALRDLAAEEADAYLDWLRPHKRCNAQKGVEKGGAPPADPDVEGAAAPGVGTTV
jgi:putative membrane protein